MSAASLALVACDNHASTTVAEATPTSGATPTPAPITPVVDEKAANWKIIEDMRKGIVQSTPSPAPTIAPHLLMGDNKADYKEPTRTKAEIKAEKLSEKNHNIQDRKTENEAAENNSALDNSEHLYQWTQRYIEQAAGAGFGGLIAAHVTFGPYTTT